MSTPGSIYSEGSDCKVGQLRKENKTPIRHRPCDGKLQGPFQKETTVVSTDGE